MAFEKLSRFFHLVREEGLSLQEKWPAARFAEFAERLGVSPRTIQYYYMLMRELAQRMPQVLEEWDDWVPVGEAARFTGIKVERLRLHCRKGRIRCKKLAGVWLISKKELASIREGLSGRGML